MILPITKRQKEILDYISNAIRQNGYAPSLEEIRDHFKLKAISTVHEHLENLKTKGYIKKEMNQARGVQILEGQNTHKVLEIVGTLNHDNIQPLENDATKELTIDTKLLEKSKNHYCLIIGQEFKSFGCRAGDFVVVSETKEAKLGDFVITKTGRAHTLEIFNNQKNIAGKVVCIIHSLK